MVEKKIIPTMVLIVTFAQSMTFKLLITMVAFMSSPMSMELFFN